MYLSICQFLKTTNNTSNIPQLILKSSLQYNSFLQKYCDPKNLKISNECSQQLEKFNDNYNYQYDKKDDCDRCIFDKNNNKKITIYHHTFWKLNNLFDDYERRVLKLNLMSYLATQNLCCSKFYFWKLENFPQVIEKDLLKSFSYYFSKKIIEFKLFNLKNECETSYLFKNHQICSGNTLYDSFGSTDSVSLSDFVRFFVLDQYGGIYTDGDVLYLKNMQLLWNFNFAYRWSFTPNTINTAVLGINNFFDSSISDLYKQVLLKSDSTYSLISNFHPDRISNDISLLNNGSVFDYKPLKTLHSYLFDSAWLCYDGIEKPLNSKSVCNFEDFTKKNLINETEFQLKDFFPGAFNYHIHLKNARANIISTNSYFVYFENYFKSYLKLK